MQTDTISGYDQRIAYEVPIMISKRDTEFYHQAKMYNFGGTNIYFESAVDAPPGSDIHIQMDECPHDGVAVAGSRSYHAKVMWCKEILDNFTFYYGVNVQISE